VPHKVRVKLYKPDTDNFGTRWVEATVDDHGAGTVVFSVYKPSCWTKFRVATLDNGRVYQENMIRGEEGIEVEPGDAVTVDFVIHELAFRVRLNDDLDEEDEAVMALASLKRRLRSPSPGRVDAQDAGDHQ
jgi:hypothetical protein